MDSNKKIVYIVTAGEYSDYRILAVFSTSDAANKYVSNYNADIQKGNHPSNWHFDDASIEEWEMDIRE